MFSEIYFPWGWQATIDGNPAQIGRVNYLLRAINLPAGSHTVEMKFEPQAINTSITTAKISVILIYILLAAAIILAFISKPEPANEEKA